MEVTNKEKRKEYNKKYYLKNRDKILEATKIYHREHKRDRNEYFKK